MRLQHMETQLLSYPAVPSAVASDRLIGVEIEFSGLPEDRVAYNVAAWLGGTVCQTGEHRFAIETAGHGDWAVELDTAWTHQIHEAGDLAASVARTIVPVEIVTAPIAEAELSLLQKMLGRLAQLGAKGSRESLVGAYGIHFNPSESDPETRVVPTMRAYAALEPWLREVSDLDLMRKLLPFIAPWPKPLVRELLKDGAKDLSLSEAMELYLTHVHSRNHGLDMLPLFRHVDGERVDRLMPKDHGIGARPTYHFRLPECRLDEPGWSLMTEWAKWWLVETVAAAPGFLDHLTRSVRDAEDPVEAAAAVLKSLTQRKEFACLVLR